MCRDDEDERQILYDLGLTINWNCISRDEWEKMLKRNEQSKQAEQLEDKINEKE